MNTLYIYLLIAVGNFLTGFYVASYINKANTTKAALVVAEQKVKDESKYASTVSETLSTYGLKLKMETSSSLVARTDLSRLQHNIKTFNVPETNTCSFERTRINYLNDVLIEGAELVEEGSRHVEQLRATNQALIGIQE